MNRRWRVPRVARARRFEPRFATAVASAPAWAPETIGRPKLRKPALMRRGRSFGPVQSQGQVAPPSFVPSSLRVVPRRVPVGRRGRFVIGVDLAAPAPLSTVRPASPRSVPPRRGRFLTFPAAAPVVVAPAMPPALFRQVRRPQLAVRRGHITNPLAAVAAPVVVPLTARNATRVVLSRRGRFWLVPAAQSVTVGSTLPPASLRHASRQFTVVRRGRFGQVPIPPVVPSPVRSVVVTAVEVSSRWTATDSPSRWWLADQSSRWQIQED